MHAIMNEFRPKNATFFLKLNRLNTVFLSLENQMNDFIMIVKPIVFYIISMFCFLIY